MFTWQYLVKALYAGVVTFLGSLLAVMQSADVIAGSSWVAIALATVVAVGGVLGLQLAPATVATGVKPK